MSCYVEQMIEHHPSGIISYELCLTAIDDIINNIMRMKSTRAAWNEVLVQVQFITYSCFIMVWTNALSDTYINTFLIILWFFSDLLGWDHVDNICYDVYNSELYNKTNWLYYYIVFYTYLYFKLQWQSLFNLFKYQNNKFMLFHVKYYNSVKLLEQCNALLNIKILSYRVFVTSGFQFSWF